MEIYLRSTKLAKILSSSSLCQKEYGKENGRKIEQRLAELKAAESLKDVFSLPAARCHPLLGDRKGQFAVDSKHPFRLVFEPANDPIPLKEDGGLDLEAITEVMILGIEDYHGG